MAFNSKTYHSNKSLKLAKRAIAHGKALRNGTHELCKVLSPDRISKNIEIAVGDARFYRNLAKLERR
jgi:hypothetical protein